ncbi:MAG: hypothetical protein AAGD32_16675, partial [Planctomycetota bacterium]
MLAKRCASASGRGGWGLLEMVAVLALMALLTGVAAVSLRGMQTNTDALALVGALGQLDATARERCRRDRTPRRLVLDFAARRAWLERIKKETGDSLSKSVSASAGRSVRWRRELRLCDVRIFDEAGQRLESGQAVVVIDADGTSPDYAFAVRADSEAVNNGEAWLHGAMIAGRTGQRVVFEGKEAFDAVA